MVSMRIKVGDFRDPDAPAILEKLPAGYSLICGRCGSRNGWHKSFCMHPSWKRAQRIKSGEGITREK